MHSLICSLATFASSEILDCKQFIFVTVVSSLPVLSRIVLKTRIVDPLQGHPSSSSLVTSSSGVSSKF